MSRDGQQEFLAGVFASWLAAERGTAVTADRKRGELVAAQAVELLFATCRTCHGEGVVQVQGFSVNPGSGVLVPDPQCVEEKRCSACRGTGRPLVLEQATAEQMTLA